MKDHCPKCGHRFGFKGAPFTLPPRGSKRRRPDYHCPACGSQLRRVEAPLERLTAWIGYIALVAACAGMLWQLLEVPVKPSRDWLVALYGVAVIGIGINIVFSITRQHFMLDDSAKDPRPVDSAELD